MNNPNWKGQMIRVGAKIKCVYDSVGDLNMEGRLGVIKGRNKPHDEVGYRAYNVLFDRQVRTKVLWEDEFEVVT